jgi:hypothetical protein
MGFNSAFKGLNMSDKTQISSEANTNENWRNISRNISFIQKGAESGSEGGVVISRSTVRK